MLLDPGAPDRRRGRVCAGPGRPTPDVPLDQSFPKLIERLSGNYHYKLPHRQNVKTGIRIACGWPREMGVLSTRTPFGRDFEALEAFAWIKRTAQAGRGIEAARKHRAHNVRVFGSTSTGHDTRDSDIDLLVTFEPHASLLDLADLEDELTAITGFPIDVISDRAQRVEVVAARARPL